MNLSKMEKAYDLLGDAREILDELHTEAKRAIVDSVTKDLAAPSDVFQLGKTSLSRLAGVHPDMMAVVQYAIRASLVDFGIPRTGGVRTKAMQAKLVKAGKSGTMRSRHLTGHAVDVFALSGGKASWDVNHILAIHDAFLEASEALDVPLRWGGDWDGDGKVREKGENDLVHHELSKGVYGTASYSLSSMAACYLEDLGK
jgi:peptidoglycan L-alanyl-D-glutamate endopeptidase CwlK